MQPQNKMGLRTKNPDLMFFFFLRSNNKNVISCVLTVFNKKCGLVVFLARTKGVSPAYHLQFMGGFSMAEPQSDFESL